MKAEHYPFAELELPASWRSREGEARYQRAKQTGMLVALGDVVPMRTWLRWKLIPNSFPYDDIATTHHMLIPRRKFAQLEDMDLNEMAELHLIKQELMGQYGGFLENTPSRQSIPTHYHIHCMVMKEAV